MIDLHGRKGWVFLYSVRFEDNNVQAVKEHLMLSTQMHYNLWSHTLPILQSVELVMQQRSKRRYTLATVVNVEHVIWNQLH